jgi:hypothetical protein
LLTFSQPHQIDPLRTQRRKRRLLDDMTIVGILAEANPSLCRSAWYPPKWIYALRKVPVTRNFAVKVELTA